MHKCIFCNKEIADKDLVFHRWSKKKKKKNGELTSEYPFHRKCVVRKQNTKGSQVRKVVHGGLVNPR